MPGGLAELVIIGLGARTPNTARFREGKTTRGPAGEASALGGSSRHVEEGEGISRRRAGGGDIEEQDQIAAIGDVVTQEVDRGEAVGARDNQGRRGSALEGQPTPLP